MTFEEAQNYLVTAAKAGTLMTPKHDPANLGTIYLSYRTVLATDMAVNLVSFLASGDYTIREYHNNGHPTSPIYLEIEPSAGSSFSVPASGVPIASPIASTAVDRLIALSGQNQGWHIIGEDSLVIQRKLSNGDLVFMSEL
jgi:hypothetical protein